MMRKGDNRSSKAASLTQRLVSTACGALIALTSGGLLLLAAPSTPAGAAPTWTAETAPNGDNLGEIDFVNANDGWAVDTIAGNVDLTTNGGQTWSQVGSGLPAGEEGISFANASDGIVVGLGGHIKYTTNGGTVWNVPTTNPATLDLWGVSMVNANDAWAVGSGGDIFVTTDGGAHWAAQSSGLADTFFSISCPTVTNCTAVTNNGFIDQTTNGGSTWTSESLFPSSVSIQDVSFVNQSHGHLVTNTGAIDSTIDGGITWEPQTSGVTTQLNSVSFADGSTGWAVGNGGVILGTSDNGATWSLQTSGTTNNLHGISAVDAMHAWTSGDSGTILGFSNPNNNAVTQLVISTTTTTATAGTPFSVTVSAEDASGNVVTSYDGTVHFTSTDPQAVLPIDTVLNGGTATFNVTLKTATDPPEASGPANPPNQTISVNDTQNAALTVPNSTTGAIKVNPAAATHLGITGLPTTVASGTSFSGTVEALDAYGNIATSFPTDTLTLTSSDPAAVLPAPFHLTAGKRAGSATLKTAGNQTLTVTDTTNGAITPFTSGPILVTAANATHLVVATPATAAAGSPFTFTVTAEDAAGNVATGYGGTVHFTSSDSLATLPADATLTNGTGTFTATLGTTGGQTITATDTVTASITGTSPSIDVTAGNATQLVVSAVPVQATAGSPFGYVVTAEDAFGNTVTNDDDIVSFSSTDPQATLPPPTALVNGVASGLTATLYTGTNPPEATGPSSPPNQTITATDQTLSISGTSAAIQVIHGAFSTIDWNIPATVQAGATFPVGLSAVDAYGNVVGTFNSTGNLTSTGSTVTQGTTFSNGLASPTYEMTSAGSYVIDLTIGTTVYVSPTIDVTAGNATHLVVNAPTAATAGTPFNYTVTAEDLFGNTVTNFTDPVSFTSTDAAAALPGTSVLNNGVGTFSATLKTTGTQTITATDTANVLIMGTSAGINVTAGSATHLVISAPATEMAGTSFPVTVTAEDAFGNTATADTDTLHFTSSDGAAVLPANTALVAGTASVMYTLETTGPQTVTATDLTNSENATATVNVTPATAGAIHFVVTGPATATAGSPFNFTVTAEDQFGNTDTAYTGTVHFTSSSTGSLPGDATLTNGVGTFSATLDEAGAQTITATDTVTSSITGTLGVTVNAAAATTLDVTASPSPTTAGDVVTVTVTALDQFGNTDTAFNSQVGITTTDANAILPSAGPLSHGVGTFSLTLVTRGLQTITATDLPQPSVNGSTTDFVRSGPAVSLAFTSAPTTVTANQVFTVTVTAFDQFGNVAFGDNNVVTFTTSSSNAFLPTGHHLFHGVGTFSMRLGTAGLQTLTATDPGLTTTITILVTPGPVAGFTVVAPSTIEAGVPFDFTVTAHDNHGNTIPGFNDGVDFSSAAPLKTLPAPQLMTGGVETFSATLDTTGTWTIRVTDFTGPTVSGVSNNIVVTPGAPAALTLTAPSTTITHSPFNFTVMAYDSFGNLDTTDNNFIHVLSSDPAATLPNNVALTNGVGTFSATLDTVGNQTLTVTDSINSAVTVSKTITVLPGPAVSFVLTNAPAKVVQGTPFGFTVTAYDAWGNVATTYTGLVHFSSSDPGAVLPANSHLSAGVGSFTATLNTPGTQTLTATDTVNSALTASASIIVVYPPPVAGYLLSGSDGGAYTLGKAPFEGSVTNPINAPVVGNALTPDGQGYWMVGADGGVYTFGDAGYYGSTGSLKLNKPIVGMAATPDGKGYWLVASDGGIFSFGDAAFWGSTGSIRLNQPIVGMAATPDGGGYWLVASDGGIFSFGDANFAGSLGSIKLNQPIVGMARTQNGLGYWMVAKDGGVFTFGNAVYLGSLPAQVAASNPQQQSPVYDVVGITATSDYRGYWVAEHDATVHPYGDATPFGPPLNNAGFAPNNIVAIAAEP